MAEQTEVSWPVCEVAGCKGIKLAPGKLCLAHASDTERDAALNQVTTTGVIDARGVQISDQFLEQVLAAAPRGKNGKALLRASRFDRAIFDGDVAFDAVTFEDEASFGGTTFSGYAIFSGAIFSSNASFDRATFSDDAEFGGATFSGLAGFARATFSSEASFGGATFSEDAEFSVASFSGYTEFMEVTFSGLARFGGTIFSGSASFDRATFSSDARFPWATFSGNAGFGGATFSGAAGFARAIFSGEASFDRAEFSGSAGFDQAIFSGSAGFDQATFSDDASFERAIFSGPASFSGATFSGDARFDEVTFRRPAVFLGTKFEQARGFGPVLAHRGLNLDNTEFIQSVQIEVSATGVCCRGTRFPSGVQFRLRWARVVLDDADFPAPSILTGIPRLSSETLAVREERIAKAWQRLLAGEISERPQLLSLRRANVVGLGLSNVTLANCRFADAHNLDKMRLEADVGFALAPSPLGQLSWEGRQVIAEECDWRAARSRQWDWRASRWPDWLGDRPSVLDAGQIAGLYRALRKGREDIKDEPGAADFYFGEMEMRRRARLTTGSTTGTASRGRAERGVLTAYWLVSGYGLRAWRALACLAVITALFAIAFHLVGFAAPPQPVSYWTSLLYAFRATLSLTDSDIKLTAWGQLLQGLLRLTGPVLLGLALLALRGRVKR